MPEKGYQYYKSLAEECINLRDKSKTRKEYRHWQHKAHKYMQKAERRANNARYYFSSEND